MNKTFKIAAFALLLGMVLPDSLLQAQPMSKKGVGKKAPRTARGLSVTNKAPKDSNFVQLNKPNPGQAEIEHGQTGKELSVSTRTFQKDTDVVRLPDSRVKTEEPAKPNAVLKKVVF